MTTGLTGDLKGRVVLVTGAAQGVGAAAARRAAEWGAAAVVVCDRNAERGAESAEALIGLGTRGHFIRAELADPDACEAVIAECDRTFGRLDGLVNAAALTDRGGLLDADAAFLDRMFAVNTRAPFLLMQGAARLMRRERIAGAMVNVLSMNVHCGLPELAVYSASKGALATLTRNAANALRADRIRVNGINLGWTETPTEHVVQTRLSPHGADWLAEGAARQPIGRLIDVEELADLIAFLLSPHSGVMTGAVIDYEQAVAGAPR